MEQGTTVQMNTDPQVVDMALGHPSPGLLPLDLIQAAAEHRFVQRDPLILQYGHEQGDLGFRTELARFLERRTGGVIAPESLMVTGGVSQAIAMLCSLYTRPGDEVVVEDPTYFLALRIFADFGLQVTSLPGDSEGLDPEALEEYLRNRSSTAPLRFLYTIPVFQNPTGKTISSKRRQRIIELAEKYELLIIADEAYQLLGYEVTPPPPMACSASSRVISLGSFSKILGPGLRLGWLQAESEQIKRIISCGMLDSGGGLNPFTSAIVRSMFQSGSMDRHLDRLIEVYRQRMNVLSRSIWTELAEYAEFVHPGGGYFLWVKLPDGVDTHSLKKAAGAYKVNFIPGSRTSPRGSFQQYLRLSISYNDEVRLQLGVQRVAEALKGVAAGL
ncbi:MAG: PLP-dependent aminotransferase family protein [Spirochaetia bacterium]